MIRSDRANQPQINPKEQNKSPTHHPHILKLRKW